MTPAQQQRALRKEFNLPFRCECGGKLEYEHAFGRIFNHCTRCTPVVNWPKIDRLVPEHDRG